jgi:hypothetical protein
MMMMMMNRRGNLNPPSQCPSDQGLWLRPHGHWDRHYLRLWALNFTELFLTAQWHLYQNRTMRVTFWVIHVCSACCTSWVSDSLDSLIRVTVLNLGEFVNWKPHCNVSIQKHVNKRNDTAEISIFNTSGNQTMIHFFSWHFWRWALY